MLCHSVAEERITRRPKKRYMSAGDAFINPSTTGDARPGGDIAGASATNTLTFAFNAGQIDSAANACAVPWLKPM